MSRSGRGIRPGRGPRGHEPARAKRTASGSRLGPRCVVSLDWPRRFPRRASFEHRRPCFCFDVVAPGAGDRASTLCPSVPGPAESSRPRAGPTPGRPSSAAELSPRTSAPVNPAAGLGACPGGRVRSRSPTFPRQHVPPDVGHLRRGRVGQLDVAEPSRHTELGSRPFWFLSSLSRAITSPPPHHLIRAVRHRAPDPAADGRWNPLDQGPGTRAVVPVDRSNPAASAAQPGTSAATMPTSYGLRRCWRPAARSPLDRL